MATGKHSSSQIYLYGEDDTAATHSELLNLGMRSVSTAITHHIGTAAKRAAHAPRYGETWRDTDNNKKLWRGGSNGRWRQACGIIEAPAGQWVGTNNLFARAVTLTLPTTIENGEKIAISVVGSSYYEVANVGAITSSGNTTSVQVLITRFYNATVAPVTIYWEIVG